MNVEIHTAKNGEQTLKINDYFIHSRYNPSREALQIATKQYMPHHVHVIFGYGSGHLVNAMLEIRDFQELLIVVDPLFDENVIERPFSDEQQKVYYLKAETINDFEQYLSHLGRGTRIKYKVLNTPNYEKLFGEEYRFLLEKVKDLQNRNLVNDATLLKFSKIWYQNFLENLTHLNNDYSGRVLHKAYTAPVVVVSGGPSLVKQMDLLKAYRNQLILVCAGSAINSLLKEGMEPDYVVTIDGGAPNFRHFQNIELQQAKIVYTLQNHPGVRASFEKPGYVVESQGHPTLTRFVKEILGIELPMFLGGASVAHTAFNFANYITTGPVALIGQDLAYTGDLTHAVGNIHARKIDEAFIARRQAFQITGFDGEKVWTDPVFNSMRLEFEDLIKLEPPENEFYNCTEGGAYINGFEQIAFKEFCERFAQKQVEIVEHTQFNCHFDEKEVLGKELQPYKKLLNVLNEAMLILKRNYSKKQFDHSSLKQLDKIDEKIRRLIEVVTIDLLIAPVTMRITQSYLAKENETPLEQFERSYRQMEDLYSSMIEKVKEATAIVNEIIEKRNLHE